MRARWSALVSAAAAAGALLAACQPVQLPPESSSVVIERAGTAASEESAGPSATQPPQTVGPRTEDEAPSTQTCSAGLGCFDVLCSATLSIEEDVPLRVHLADLCTGVTGLTSAVFLTGDRLASLDLGGDQLKLHARRYDGGRTVELELIGYAYDTALGSLVVQVNVADNVQANTLVEAERVRRDGFEYRTYFTVGADGTTEQRYPVLVSIPEAQESLPVELFLHGFSGEPRFSIERDHITIMPSDPDNTYWWGEKVGGHPLPTTQWRVVDALTELLLEIPGADPERVVISGASMGGAGAAAIGFTYPELFAGIVATDGQAVPRNHRARRVAQLTTLWGPPGPLDPDEPVPGWDTTDLTWLLEVNEAARDVPVFSRYGRDDAIIHFGALIEPSPLTGNSWLAAMHRMNVPWVLGWDEGGHVAVADGLERDWWTAGWNPLTDSTTYVSRVVPALGSRSSQRDGDPGDGTGNGRRDRDENSAFAGDPAVPGDDGWTGDAQGVIGGWVSWNSDAVVERPEVLQIPVRLAAIANATVGTVDIAMRRTQVFRPARSEWVIWTLGEDQSGTVELTPDGAYVLSGVELTDSWQLLELRCHRGH